MKHHHHVITGIAAAVLGGGLLLALEARRSRPQQPEGSTRPVALTLPPPVQESKAKLPPSSMTAAPAAKAGAGNQGLWAGIAADMAPAYNAPTEQLHAERETVLLPPPPRPAAGGPDGAALWGRATPGARGQTLGTWPSPQVGGLEPWAPVEGNESPPPKGGGGEPPPILQPGPEWS